MKTLYFFNPENDMALASGSLYYMAPASAKKMALDLSTLPVWYAEKGSGVLLSTTNQIEWMNRECPFSFDLNYCLKISSDYKCFFPWGWSPVVKCRLESLGILGDILPTSGHIDRLRLLSSRRTAVDLLPRLRVDGTLGESEWLLSVEDVSAFVEKKGSVLLKAPWSGSGKGLQSLTGVPDGPIKGWINRIVSTQGGIVGEPLYNKVVDFAMEFQINKKVLSFVGYSMFETDKRGIYKGNILFSNERIEECLSVYLPLKLLHKVRDRLMFELSSLLCDSYEGYLGVDMMVCCIGKDKYALHPCVELNLRMNMGLVSRIFYDRYVCSDVMGKYLIEYFPKNGEALLNHKNMQEQYPLEFENGRIRKGYCSLTPVFEETNYQVFVHLF